MITDDSFMREADIKSVSDILLSNSFPWYINDNSIDYEKEKNTFINNKYSDSFQLTHTFYNDGLKKSDLLDIPVGIFNDFMKSNNMSYRSILRIKANLNTKSDKENNIQPAHTDFNFDHDVFIYYINDSDGDTIIFNEKNNDEEVRDLTVLSKISPKAGRGLTFNGRHYHSPSRPINTEYRCIINISYIGE